MIGQVTERATAMWDHGARWDEILETLRAEGFSKVECIRATVEILRLPLADAKRIVHDSRAWAHRRKNDEQFHDVLEAEFRAEASAPDPASGPIDASPFVMARMWHDRDETR